MKCFAGKGRGLYWVHTGEEPDAGSSQKINFKSAIENRLMTAVTVNILMRKKEKLNG